MTRYFIILMLLGPSILAHAAETTKDPFKPLVKKVGQTFTDVKKSAIAEIDKQRAPAEKPKAAAPKKTTPKKPAAEPSPSSTAKKPAADEPAKKPTPKPVPAATDDQDQPEKPAPAVSKKTTSEQPTPEMPTEGPETAKAKSPHGKPAVISSADLADFDALPGDRKKLIEGAIAVARDSAWLPYKFGGSSPADGGFDCSGAMYFVMNKAGLKPPRTSAEQFLWLKSKNRLREVPPDVSSIDHPSLAMLRPGDLLFWSGTYAPTDGRTANITHVAMYLGKEKKGARAVMINATDGRSYRGTQANGYGVYDFYLPREGSKSKFVGYGTPPGIPEKTPEPTPSVAGKN